MDDHKLVTISFFGFFFKKKNMKKMQLLLFFFMKNMLGKILGFGRMHENKFFLKGKLI